MGTEGELFEVKMGKPWTRFYDPDVPETIDPSPRPFHRILDDAADRDPSRSALFFFGGKVRYGLLRAHVNQFAGALSARGFRPRDSLGILLPNMPQAIVSFFAALKIGGQAAFFDPLASREELRDQLNASGVETLILLDLIYSRIQALLPQTRVKHLIVCRVKDYLPFPKDLFFSMAAKGYGLNVKLEPKENLVPYQEFLASGRPDWAPASPDLSFQPAETAVLHYQSSPGGGPRGLQWTEQSLMANLQQICAWLGKIEEGPEVFLSVLPYHQPEGLILGMSLPIYLGGLSIQLPQFDLGRAFQMIQKHRVTFFPATHGITESVAHRPLFKKRELSSIRILWSIGDTLNPEIVENLERKIGGKVTAAYGPSDAMALTHANPLYGKRKAGSIGIPLPGTEAKIVDPMNPEREKSVGEKGELVVKGPQMLKPLFPGGDRTRRGLPEDWFPTGDWARMDEDGFFYVSGKIHEKDRASA
jgi:long-chain acyl-CoA synthetase